MTIREVKPDERITAELIRLSKEWESENSCWGYRANTADDINGRRIFLAEDDGMILGYLFGKTDRLRRKMASMPEHTPVFEIEELYVLPSLRSRGIGATLFHYAEMAVKNEAEYILLSTAAKNARAILHFYLEELDMQFWSATLFRKIEP